MTLRLPPHHRSLHFIVASGLLSGCFSKAPGTVGSLACLLLWLGAAVVGQCLAWSCDIAFVAVTLVCGIWATSRCLIDLSHGSDSPTDPQFVVIDEWAGLLIPLALATPDQPATWLGAFTLFRFFDIAKPWPVSAAERLPGAWGVMADDLVAGGLAAAVLFGGIEFFR